MAVDPITLSAIGSAVSASTPFLTRALGGLFGVKSAEEEQRERIEQSIAPYARIAQGGTTQGQAGLAYARGRAAQELAGQAARGTAQQQAGLQREAMRVGQDTGAQYAAQLSELRSREQERAMMGVAAGQRALSALAGEEAQRKRQELSGAISGTLGSLAKVFLPGDAGASGGKLTEDEIAAYNAANTKGRAAVSDYGAAFQQRTNEMAGAAAPATSEGGITSKQAAAALGFDLAAPVAKGSTYQQRTGMPGVTASEMAPAQQVADLRAERNLATANVGPARQVDYTAGMSNGTGEFASLADRQEAISSMAPFMKSPAEQGASASLAPTKTPMAFSNEGEQVEGLRKARPGRMPRKPGQTVRGGGGYAL
jgi:hypothetical protein